MEIPDRHEPVVQGCSPTEGSWYDYVLYVLACTTWALESKRKKNKTKTKIVPNLTTPYP